MRGYPIFAHPLSKANENQFRNEFVQLVTTVPHRLHFVHLNRSQSVGVAGEVLGDRCCNRESGALLVVAERWARIDFEADIATVRRAPEVDTSKGQSSRCARRTHWPRVAGSTTAAAIVGSMPVCRMAYL